MDWEHYCPCSTIIIARARQHQSRLSNVDALNFETSAKATQRYREAQFSREDMFLKSRTSGMIEAAAFAQKEHARAAEAIQRQDADERRRQDRPSRRSRLHISSDRDAGR